MRMDLDLQLISDYHEIQWEKIKSRGMYHFKRFT